MDNKEQYERAVNEHFWNEEINRHDNIHMNSLSSHSLDHVIGLVTFLSDETIEYSAVKMYTQKNGNYTCTYPNNHTSRLFSEVIVSIMSSSPPRYTDAQVSSRSIRRQRPPSSLVSFCLVYDLVCAHCQPLDSLMRPASLIHSCILKCRWVEGSYITTQY